MDAIECLVTRRSIRNYTKEPVSAGDIENVVEIAQMVSCCLLYTSPSPRDIA